MLFLVLILNAPYIFCLVAGGYGYGASTAAGSQASNPKGLAMILCNIQSGHFCPGRCMPVPQICTSSCRTACFFILHFFYSHPCCSIYFPWLLWPGPANAHKKGLGKGQKGLEKGQKGLEKGQQEEESSTSSSNSDQSSPSTDGEKGKGAPKGARPKAKGKGGAKAAPEVKKEVDQGNGDWVQVVRKGNRRKK